MPRKLTVHFECERCRRTWLKDYKEGESLPVSAGFKAALTHPDENDTGVNEVTEADFECLCDSCYGAVSNYFDSILKKSPKRGAKKEAQTESEPGAIEVTVD